MFHLNSIHSHHNIQPTQQQPHSADTSQSDLGISPTENLIENLTNTLALLTQSYKTFLPQTNNQLRTSSNPRNQATCTGSRCSWLGRAQNRVGNANNPGQSSSEVLQTATVMVTSEKLHSTASVHKLRNFSKDKMLLMQAQENGVILDEEQSLFLAGGLDNAIDEDVDEQPVQDVSSNVDNVFQADDCDAYDSDVDDAPTAQTLFMANLSSADPVYDEAGPSYDSDVLSEVQAHDHYQDAVCDHHEEHEMHDDYVKDNAVPVVQNNASMVPNDAYVMIDNDLHDSDVRSVSHTPRNTVANNLLNAETENLKKELHSIKLQLASTIQHNKLMVDEVTSLKKDFNQKENKFLEEFLDLKALKDRVEDKLFKQGLYSNSSHDVQVQPALYSGHVIVTPNHAPAVVRDCEETLEQSEISRKKMHDKMKAKACVDNKVNITPPNYSKENFLATFSPQKQLTPEQLFWSQDIVKMKAEALKEQNTRPIKALTVFTEMQKAHHVVKTRCLELEVELSNYVMISLKYQNLKDSFQNKPSSSVNDTPDFNSVFVIGQMKAFLQRKSMSSKSLINANLSISGDPLRAKHTEQTTALKSENESLKVQIQNTVSCVTTTQFKPKVTAPGKHLKESVDTLRDIVEEAKAERPLDRSLEFACRYTKHSQELLEYVFGTCPKVFNQQDKKHAPIP
ncbi:hypothetical protein Tco_0294070 [Tanacetum coccineum]